MKIEISPLSHALFRQEVNRIAALLFLAIIAAFGLSEQVRAQVYSSDRPPSDVYLSEKTKAYNLYLSGKVSTAIPKLEALANASSSSTEQASVRRDVIEICATTYDWVCVNRNISAVLDLMKSNDSIRNFMPDLLLYELRANLWFGNLKYVEDSLLRGQFSLANPIKSPLTATETQITFHSYFVRQDQLDRAEDSISAALVGLFLTDPKKSPYGYARTLISLIEAYGDSGDIYSAFRLLQISSNFIENNLSHDGFLFARFKYVVGNLLAVTDNYAAVVQVLSDFSVLMEKIDVDQSAKEFQLSAANSLMSAALILDGKTDAAKAMHSKHPMQQDRESIISRGEFKSLSEYYFAISDIFISVAANNPVDDRWAPLFQKPIPWNLGKTINSLLDSYRAFSLGGIQLSRGDKEGGAKLLIQAATQRINGFQVVLKKSFEGFPLPNIVDRIVISLGLQAAAVSNSQDAIDLMLKGSEVLNRNLRDELVDTTILVGSQNTEAKRRDAQSFAYLVKQKKEWEFKRIEIALNSENFDTTNLGGMINSYTGAVSKVVTLKQTFRSYGIEDQKDLTNLKSLQEALSSKDIFITSVPVATGLLKICITKNNYQFHIGEMNPEEVSQSIKVLQLSLQASHAPNKSLDIQFPASAAVFLKKTLFEGLENCLERGTNIITALPKVLASIPLSVLLDALPNTIDDGYDLRKAKWLIKKYSFSSVISPRQFVILAKAAKRPSAELPFLGVGDPELPKSNSSLPELPETRVELKTIGTLLNSSSNDILVGKNSTEETFRNKPLYKYDIIHFATHNITDVSLKKSDQSGLVFTVGSTDDKFDNGFLTAPEIARLKLNARLVVLSACNTARFDLAQATLGVRDLQVAFTVAGTPTVLASLWPVDSTTTKDLMVSFFRAWRGSNIGAAEALARSIRQNLQKADIAHQHPRFWAPFIVFGYGGVALPTKIITSKSRSFRSLQKSGGEIIDLHTSSQGLFISAMGGWNGKKMSNYIFKFDQKGRQLWKNETREIGAGNIVEGNSVIYSVGSLSAEESFPVARALDHFGQVKWTTKFDSLAGYIFSNPIINSNGFIVIATPYLSSDKKSNASFILHISDQGKILRRLAINAEVEGINVSRSAFIFSWDGKIVAAINGGAQSGMDESKISKIGLAQYCFKNRKSSIFIFDATTMTLIKSLKIQDFSVESAVENNKDLLLGGIKYSDCELNGDGGILSLSPTYGITEFWHLDSDFSSSVRGLTSSNNKIYAAIGINRELDLRDETIISDTDWNKRWGDNGKSILEGAILEFSEEGKLLSSDDLSAGLQIWPNGIRIINGQPSAFGSLGGEPAMNSSEGFSLH